MVLFARRSGAAPLVPELKLVAACCRWPRSAARTEAIRAAAAGPVDWQRLLRIAVRHRVEPLVRDGLAQAELTPPGEVRDALAARAAAAARLSLAMAGESLRLRKTFEAAAIPILFVKGEALAALAYGGLGLKSGRDIDLLVAPGDFARAGALLGAQGYVQIEPDPMLRPDEAALHGEIEKETVWRHPRTGIVLDLHRRLVNAASLIPAIGMGSPVQEVKLGSGGSLPTLATRELFVYLCAHGALCGWMRLKWLADLAALLAGRGEEEIEALYRFAEEQGAGRCAGPALLLCERLFGTPLPAGLAGELRRDRATRWLERIALDSIAGGDGATDIADRPAAALATLLAHFLLGTGWKYRLEIARERWLNMEDRQRIRLPRRLSFLYHFLRIPMALWRARRMLGGAAA